MLEILKQAHAEGIKQTKSVVLARSDYMCNVVTDKETNEQTYELKQIEMNAGQIGGLAVSGPVTKVHRRTLWKAGIKATRDQVPDNEPHIGAAEVLYKAWQAFGNPNAIIMFIPDFADIEYQIERLSEGKIKIVRIPLPKCVELNKDGKLILNPHDFSLQLEGQTVAVVYRLTDPPTYNESEWNIFRMFERSTAIQSPTMALGLATQKKMQQVLAKPGMVERFLYDQLEIVPLVRSTFAGLWNLNDQQDEDSQKAIKNAIEQPENYVIKPNMEGGGNNFFNEKVREKLLNFTENEREAHILMQKLSPMIVKNYMVRGYPKKPLFGEVTTELGIFGFLLGDSRDDKQLHNVQKGHFLRTKLASVNEGGVSLGTGVYDSPFLIL